MVKLVILDRDGVINEDSPRHIRSPDEWSPIANSLEAIVALNTTGIKVAIATNQSGVARGYFTEKTLKSIHDKMKRLLIGMGGKIDYLAYCTDAPDSKSKRRKPEPGMLLEISKKLKIPLNEAVFIGDSYRDYEAAVKAKCPFVLVKTGKGESTLSEHPELANAITIYNDLAEFVAQLLAENEV